MAVTGVNPTGPSYSDLTKSTAKESATQGKKGFSQFRKLQADAKFDQTSALLSKVFNVPSGGVATFQVKETGKSTFAQFGNTGGLAEQQAKADGARQQAAEAGTASASPVTQRNMVVNTQSTNVAVAQGKNNNVKGATGWASYGNNVNVTGNNNNVDIAGQNTNALSEVTYNATGGAEMRNNQVQVQGNQNNVQFTGQRLAGNTVNVSGTGNAVSAGNGVQNATVDIQANNVTVNIKQNDLLTKSNSGWNVSVNASDISVSIENGVATVTGAGAANAKVEINNEDRTVKITAVA